jgi:hypothetical protein
MARADALGGERMLLLGLFLAHNLLGVDVPVTVLDKARADSTVEKLAEDVRRRCLRSPMTRRTRNPPFTRSTVECVKGGGI